MSALLLAALLLGCKDRPQPTPEPAAEAPVPELSDEATQASAPDAAPSGDPDGEPASIPEAEPAPRSQPAPATKVTPGTGAAGASCLSHSDCASGVCEGEGCSDDQPGTCAPEMRPCTRDLRPYCGCDGATFRTSGSCPGQRFAHRGACEGDPVRRPMEE